MSHGIVFVQSCIKDALDHVLILLALCLYFQLMHTWLPVQLWSAKSSAKCSSGVHCRAGPLIPVYRRRRTPLAGVLLGVTS